MANSIRAISRDGGIVVTAIDSTNIVQDMERYHQTSAVVSAALGRLLTAASLMGSNLKNEDDSITLRISGGGPVGTLLAVSDGQGNVRGYAQNPVVEIPLRPDGKLDVGSAVGHEGTLSVIRDMGLKEPYIGQVPLVSGEIAEDITSYYVASEQTPSACALGVLVDKDLHIKRAGGYLLQLLPGATDEEISKVEQNIQKVPSVTEFLEQQGSIKDLVEVTLAGFEPNILDEMQLDYRCYCSKERSRQILIGLGEKELQRMAQENPVAEIQCHFCDQKYEIDLPKLLQEMSEKTEASTLTST